MYVCMYVRFFYTIYKDTLLDKLLDILHKVVDFMFKGGTSDT